MAVTLLFGLYCLEAGIFFIIAPWTRFWSLSPLLHSTPALSALVDNPYFRGMVSGFGVAHIVIGIHAIGELLASRAEHHGE